MEKMNDMWVAEYSASQGCFNVTTLGDAIKANVSMVRDRSNNDYLAFGTYPTIELAHQACTQMKREQERNAG